MNYRILTILWVFLVHLAGIYLFTRGFLLMRLSLGDISTRKDTVEATHKRAVFLIIDALRFDFITQDPPEPVSPYHHNVLTLPRTLTKQRPQHSFIFNAYADPPTTTLQRIKGLTTGSLPTFIDIGNNLGASSISEDSLMVQLQRAGRKSAFMGDDTWMSVFPDTFERNMTFPFDSFNVEDLHTVDEGVIAHLFPLLEDKSKPFDFAIGHFLGVDHVGHRVGPDHPSMKAKLEQMNEVLGRVVDLLDEDTLLVVLGDHGMDRSGDHGGDGALETSAAMWVYSKGAPLAGAKPPSGLLQYRTFPGTTRPHRGIQQIDILPTLSLLLGLPIPFNNLGTVIPEFFDRGNQLEKALKLNADQIYRYLQAYRASPSGGELDDGWAAIQSAWSAAAKDDLVALNNFNRVALSECRAMWAQFNPGLMAMGLLILGMGLCASWSLFVGVSDAKSDWEKWLGNHIPKCLFAGAAGGLIGALGLLVGQNAVNFAAFGAALASTATVVILSPPVTSLASLHAPPLTLILHSIAFFSNSFTFWEDRIVPFLAVSSVVPLALKGFAAPTARLRYRIVGFSVLYAACVRLISISTICREEQQPYCHVTFYASSSQTSPPLIAIALGLPAALALSLTVRRFLKISLSDRGVAKMYYPFIFAPSLIAGAAYWMLEWADTTSALGEEWTGALRFARTYAARFTFAWVLLLGGALWYTIPLCVDISAKQEQGQKQIRVIGYANAFGSPYLIFWTLSLAIVYLTSQLPGQLVLSLATIALLSYLEVLDSVRDVQAMELAFASATPSSVLDPDTALKDEYAVPFRFSDVVPLALLGLHAFYGTGHQSTISSIQWKAAFLLSSTVTYPWSAITVVVNSIGPIFLFAAAAPLLALWNRAPGPSPSKEEEKEGGVVGQKDTDNRVKGDSLLSGLAIMTYYVTVLLGTSISAAILRRHLMVWKVFAPRFMAAVLGVLAVDLGVLLGEGVGVERVTKSIRGMFQRRDAQPTAVSTKAKKQE
ncbi:hypothetical protein DFP72DRAFT_893250 [Ephemerocybe angulata]|uniref:GPI ethanolamine phosphate transferase 2 C-terminal domain-containing protein n=1 Tax=Ephemerocybe angulata TaxID=980116 RepID=A0A8H6I399_9AGAR|nr:hypothetical protein DFP72DRAFT_893250 [Tulosesus angulatus]